MSMFALNVPQWNDIQQIEVNGAAHLRDDNCVIIPTQAGELCISLLHGAMRMQIGKVRAHDYGILQGQSTPQNVQLSQDDELIAIRAQTLMLRVYRRPLHFELYSHDKLIQKSADDGHFVRQFRLPPFAYINDQWWLTFDLKSHEPIYGLGEKWGKLDKRGQLIRSYNHDALGVNAEISYKNTPFAWSPDGWGVFAHTPSPVTHAVGYAPWSHRAYGMLVEDAALDVFVFVGRDGAEILDQYTALTGRAPAPPPWSLGVILSKAYYRDATEILETASAVREHHMPCDTITLDGRCWQDTDTRFAFQWDSKRYDDPASLLAKLKALNFKVCVWEYPLISVQNPLFDALARKGWLIKDSRTGLAFRYHWDSSAFGDVLTPLPESGILDFTHPEAYAFWRDSHKALFDIGVDMIKADFGEQIEDPHMLAHNGERGSNLHNVYALLYNRCVYDAASRYSKTGAFLFSRAGWTGSQRYPAQWGGDPQADWNGMAASLRGGLSWGMSGAPYYATDVGGFYKDARDPELFVRWVQAAIFSSHIRLHGIGQREPWSYGVKAEHAALKALRFRYRLLPYIKQLVDQAGEHGLPAQRAMALAFPEERAAWAFEEQFMFGDEILVAPCMTPGGQVHVYFPVGDWMQLETQRLFSGGRSHTLELSLDEMAVFVRRGSRIPLGEAVEHTHGLEDFAISAYWEA